MAKWPLISIIAPVYNEAAGLPKFYQELTAVINPLPATFEIVFVDDGSTDDSLKAIQKLAQKDPRVRVIALVRNFGKEIALTAGFHECRGAAAIAIDTDLQHPVGKIPEFIDRWRKGAEVVVGIRQKNSGLSWYKRFRSNLFYKTLNAISDIHIVPNTTDFRLIDRVVIDEFNRFSERNRLARGLIDWLGFTQEHVMFRANQRYRGRARYGFFKLLKLAVNSYTSLSIIPLKVAGYLGLTITFLSGLLGLFILIEKYFLDDPWSLRFSGTATLAVVLLFLVGIILICLGLVALYIANIHSEVANRPLYVIRRQRK